jgi:hypothetical protein
MSSRAGPLFVPFALTPAPLPLAGEGRFVQQAPAGHCCLKKFA